MAVLSPTVVCCGKTEEDPFSFRDVVLGTSALVKDIAMGLGSSAKTLRSLPDFYSTIEVAPYLNCIKFAAQWTYTSTKRAYINMALQYGPVKGLTYEECLRAALTESWDAKFTSHEDTGHIMFIPDSEELLERMSGIIYHADTKVQTRTKSTQVDTDILKELEHMEEEQKRVKLKNEMLERILGGVSRELQSVRSQLSQYTHGSATFEEDYTTTMEDSIIRTEPETLKIPKALLQELIEIGNRIIINTSIGSLQPSGDILPSEDVVPMCIAVLEDQVKYFNVASSQWQQLHTLRQRIRVDAYDPRSNTFALQDFTLPESDSQTIAVVSCGLLTVLSINYNSKLQQGRLTSQKHEEYYPWSNCTPVVSEGAIYVVKLYEKCCLCIDLTTGAVRKLVSLS